MILPVNTTVGRSGAVLITLKSRHSIPPYRIENRCKKVAIRLRQAAHEGARGSAFWDEVGPNSNMNFAWDEPQGKHNVEVQGAIVTGGNLAAIDWDLYSLNGTTEYDFAELNSKRELEIKMTRATFGGIYAMGGSSPSRTFGTGGGFVGRDSSRLQASILGLSSFIVGHDDGEGVDGAGSGWGGVLSGEGGGMGPLGRSRNAAASVKAPALATATSSAAIGQSSSGSGWKAGGTGVNSAAIFAGGAAAMHGGGVQAVPGMAHLNTALAKRVFVRVYADGPTRVLCFSDEQFVGLADEENGLQQLGYRLQQASRKLKQVDRQLTLLLGPQQLPSGRYYRTAGLVGPAAAGRGSGGSVSKGAGQGLALQYSKTIPGGLSAETGRAAGASTSLPPSSGYQGLREGQGSGTGGAAAAPFSRRGLEGEIEPLQQQQQQRALKTAPSGTGSLFSSGVLQQQGQPRQAVQPAGRVPGPGEDVWVSTANMRVELDKLMAVLDSSLPLGGDLKVRRGTSSLLVCLSSSVPNQKLVPGFSAVPGQDTIFGKHVVQYCGVRQVLNFLYK